MNQFVFSIVICTYNRAEWLDACLMSLKGQLHGINDIEIIVVDNNSGDNTSKIVNGHIPDFFQLVYTKESRQGLSYARNRGVAAANSGWINFLDDDARVMAGYITKIRQHIADEDYDCLGGVYLAWYPDGRSAWFRDEYASNLSLSSHLSELAPGKFVSGGIMLVRRSALLAVGGFNTAIGMKGGYVAYGEETHFQLRLRQEGFRIGFDPDWRIEHRVPLYKQQLSWQLRSSWAVGRDSWTTFERVPSALFLFRLGWRLLARPARSLMHELRAGSQPVTLQSWVLTLLSPFILTLGEITQGLRLLLKSQLTL